MLTETGKTSSGFKTGGVTVRNPVWLAPLAGITNSVVRKFFIDIGAGLVHSEMVSCAGLQRGMDKTTRMLDSGSEEDPMVLQLFAGDTETLVKGADVALARGGFAAFSINMACPMPKVLKKGAGARLLDHPKIAFQMARELRERGLPVWVKMRKCGYRAPLSTSGFCEGLIDAGVSHITIHGRTPSQRYEGTSDYGVITEAAGNFSPLVSASGDIFKAEDVAFFLENGCSAVLIARGALRDPFIFPRALAKLGYRVPEKFLAPTTRLQVDLLVQLGDEMAMAYGDKFAEIIVRRLMAGMFKGIHGISGIRIAAAGVHGWSRLRQLLKNSFLNIERGSS